MNTSMQSVGKRYLPYSFLLALLVSFSFSAWASSHREAPLIANDPLADNVDLYAFRSPDAPNTVTLIATYVPMQIPQGGPNYYGFGENIRYEIHIDNDAAKPGDEIVYRFTFKKENQDPTTFFNIRLGQQNLKTTYTLEKSVDGGNTFMNVIIDGEVPPTNVGTRSIESGIGLGMPYSELMANAITNASSGEKVFCGPSDDPFFVDLGGVFDLGDLPRQNSDSRDGLACYNVSTIAIQVPISDLLKEGAADTPANILDSDYVIGVWASASRPSMRTLNTDGTQSFSGDWVQVSRLGMPLTNEVVIPIGMKDFWNAITPYDEITNTSLDGFFYNPELGLYMDDDQFGAAVPAFSPLRIQRSALGAFDFGNGNDGLFALKGSDAVAGTALDDAVFGTLLLPGAGQPRSVDLWPIFHTGVPNVPPYQLATGKDGNPLAAGKPFINNFLPNGGDMLRLNMAVPVTARDNASFSPLGIIQAAVLGLLDPNYNTSTEIQNIPNMDGFPNGRRLEDDVTRIELQAVAGAALAAIGLWYDDFDPETGNPVTEQLLGVLGYDTGVSRNDVAFQESFPYVAMPFSGTGECSSSNFEAENADLELSIEAMETEVEQFQEVPFVITLKNRGPASATGVTVMANLPEGLVFTRSDASQGTYGSFGGRWDIGTLDVGQTVTLDQTLYTLAEGVDITNYVQVSSSMTNDRDSDPANGNGMVNEDDEAAVTITVAERGENTNEDNEEISSETLKVNRVYPSPAKERVQLDIESSSSAIYQVDIIDAAGVTVQSRTVNLVEGLNNLQFNTSNLITGLYLIVLENEKGESIRKRVIVQQ